MAIALAAAIASRAARRLDPASRANLWLLAIFLAAAIPALTVLLPSSSIQAAEPAFLVRVDGSGTAASQVIPIWLIALAVLAVARAAWLAAGMWSLGRLSGRRRVLLTGRIAVPATFGLFRPVIALPRKMWAEASAGVRRAILAHEFQHLRRRDYAWNLAAEWVTLAIWWHPAVWWMKRRWSAEREFACDAATAARIPGYPALLLSAAQTLVSPAPRLALGMFDYNHLEERLMRLTRPMPPLRGLSARAVRVSAAALLLAAGSLMILRPVVRAQGDGPVYRAGGDVSAPRIVTKIEPSYTEQARNAKIQGTAVIAVVIGEAGKVTEAAVRQGIGWGLDEEALAAIYQWSFVPGYKDGKPVAVSATIEVNFRLLD
jgi:TonB family protein